MEDGYDLAPMIREFGGPLLRVPVIAAPRWMLALWVGDVAAVALPGVIFVRAEVLGWPPRHRAPIVVHELTHVRQWHDIGVRLFLTRYVGEYLRGRRGGRGHTAAYAAISFEIEARDLAARLCSRRSTSGSEGVQAAVNDDLGTGHEATSL